MAVDKVKPLKIEDSTSGTQNDGFPVETSPTQDYLAAKGIAFENSDTRLFDLSAGGEIQWQDAGQTTYKTINSLSGPNVWSVLGRYQFASAANASSIIDIAARDILRITIIVTGYSGNGIFSLRFGGTAGAVDSGNNYNTRYLRINSGANNNFTDVPTTTTNMMRLASQAIVLGRSATVNVTNFSTKRKMSAILTASEAGAVGTAANLDVGQGMWGNTTQQIIAVQLLSTANNLSVGSGFVVEGMNLA